MTTLPSCKDSSIARDARREIRFAFCGSKLVLSVAMVAMSLGGASCDSRCRSKPAPAQAQVQISSSPDAAPTQIARAACPPTAYPAQGMYTISPSLVWYESELPGAKPRKFYWAKTGATGLTGKKTLTLIAGSIGDPKQGHCVKPPAKADEMYNPGIDLEWCPGSEPCVPETVNIRRGFLWVRADDNRNGNGGLIIPWPLIIKTRGVPAGAYSTEFVLLTMTTPADVSLREYVLRPNQEATDCTKAAGEDQNHQGSVVGAEPPGKLFKMNSTSYVLLENGTSAKYSVTAGSPEDQFLQDVCIFVKDAMGHLTTNVHPQLPCAAARGR